MSGCCPPTNCTGAGVNAINAGKVRVARPLLERGLERATDEDLKARIEASLAYVAAETGDPAGGLALCRAALARPGLRAETRGIVQSQRALLQMRSGDTPGALTSFGEAIDFLTSLPDEKARAHLNRGGVYLQQGAGDVAAADFAAAMRNFEAAGLVAEVPKAQHNLGYAAFVQGDLVSALRDMEEAGHNLPASSPVLRAISQQDRAEVLMAAGLTRQGLAALDEVARTLGQHRLHQRRGEAELTIARAALARDPERALVAARAARGRFDRSAHPRSAAQGRSARAWRRGAARADPALSGAARRRPGLRSRRARSSLVGDRHPARHGAGRAPSRRPRRGVASVAGGADPGRRTARRTASGPGRARSPGRAKRSSGRGPGTSTSRAGRPARVAELVRQPGPADDGHRERAATRGARASGGEPVAVAAGAVRVVRAGADAGQPRAAGAGAARRGGGRDLAELRTLAAKEEATREDRAREAELRQRVRERAWRTRGSGPYDEPMPLA